MMYRTIQGDTWDIIAYKVTGSELNMTTLMRANPEHVETVIFPAGVSLTTPDIEIDIADTLPKWRQEEGD